MCVCVELPNDHTNRDSIAFHGVEHAKELELIGYKLAISEICFLRNFLRCVFMEVYFGIRTFVNVFWK